MAHDSYQLLISLSFDGLLDDEEQDTLYQHMRTCAMCAETWTRMNSLDRLLSLQPQAAPSVNFAAKVMQRVQTYETRRRLHPWMLVMLAILSLLSGVSIAVPVTILAVGPQTITARYPLFGAILSMLARGFETVVEAATWATDMLLSWFKFLTGDPAALAVVITGLVLASIYIGLRESLKAMRQSDAFELETQSA